MKFEIEVDAHDGWMVGLALRRLANEFADKGNTGYARRLRLIDDAVMEELRQLALDSGKQMA